MRNSKITKIKLCLDVKNPMVKIEYFQMGIYSSKELSGTHHFSRFYFVAF